MFKIHSPSTWLDYNFYKKSDGTCFYFLYEINHFTLLFENVVMIYVLVRWINYHYCLLCKYWKLASKQSNSSKRLSKLKLFWQIHAYFPKPKSAFLTYSMFKFKKIWKDLVALDRGGGSLISIRKLCRCKMVPELFLAKSLVFPWKEMFPCKYQTKTVFLCPRWFIVLRNLKVVMTG